MLSDVFATGESKILNSLLAGQGPTIECRETKKTKNKTINWPISLLWTLTAPITSQSKRVLSAGKCMNQATIGFRFMALCHLVSYWPRMRRGNFKPIAMKETKPSCFFFVPSRERPHPRRPVSMLTPEHYETTG